jgi:hypothetical protein
LSITPASPVDPPSNADASARSRRVLRIVLALFCFEIGLILLMLPWTLLWDRNYFFGLNVALERFMLSSYVRGGISGLGFVNLWFAITETVRLVRDRR